MTLRLEHFDDKDSPFDFKPEEHSTLKLTEKGEHTYPAQTKLFDDEAGADPVLVFHAEKKFDGKLPWATNLADADNPKRRAFHDLEIARQIATHAITEVRRFLPLGALNAVYPIDPMLVADDAPANFRDPDRPPEYLCEGAAPAFLFLQAEMLWLGMACPGDVWLSPFEQLLANYYRTVYIGGGVCSMMASVSAAIVSMSTVDIEQSPDRHTKILICSHEKDHSFAMVQYGESPWVVVDPWVAEPYAVAIEENVFEANGKGKKNKLKAFSQIDIYKRFSDPFGIPLMSGWKDDHLDSKPVPGLRLTKDAIVRSIREVNMIQGGIRQPAEMLIGDAVFWSTDKKRWYQNSDAKYMLSGRAQDFHLPHMWQEPSNHKLSLTAEWEKYRQACPPVVKSNEWGLNVPGNYDAYPRKDDEAKPDTAV